MRPISTLPTRRLRPKPKRWQPLLKLVICERAFDRASVPAQLRALQEIGAVLFDLRRGYRGRAAKLRARKRQRGAL